MSRGLGDVYKRQGNVGGVTEESLRDRVTLSQEGIVTVLALIDIDTGKLVEPPEFLTRGLGADDSLFDDSIPSIEKALAAAASDGVGDPIDLEKRIGRAVSQWAGRKHRRNPLVIPVVVEA